MTKVFKSSLIAIAPPLLPFRLLNELLLNKIEPDSLVKKNAGWSEVLFPAPSIKVYFFDSRNNSPLPALNIRC